MAGHRTNYTANLTGANCGDADAVTNTGLCIATSSDRLYTLAITAASRTAFTATATPTGDQTADSCGTFAVDQDGPATTRVRRCGLLETLTSGDIRASPARIFRSRRVCLDRPFWRESACSFSRRCRFERALAPNGRGFGARVSDAPAPLKSPRLPPIW